MTRCMPCLTLMLMLALAAFGQTPAKKNGREAKIAQELRELVRKWDEADVRRDAAALDRLLAEEFTFVGGQSKAQYLASTKNRAPELTIDSAVSSDVQVQVYGNTAILTGLDTITGKYKGQPYVNEWLYMDVWIKRDGRWQCVKTYSSLRDKK
jgi:ketosteroid isomerase-like protein